jgi:hypothetical protein
MLQIAARGSPEARKLRREASIRTISSGCSGVLWAIGHVADGSAVAAVATSIFAVAAAVTLARL